MLVTAVFLAQVRPAAQASTPVAARTQLTVQGRALNALNGEAVPKVTVILRSHDQDHGVSYADQTGSNGNFSMNDVEPGEYAVVAERPGFVPQTSGATGAPPPNIKVIAGQQPETLTIRLTPLGVISGRVVDSDGDPVPGAMVQALVSSYNAGKKELRDIEQVMSGDNGQFRLFGLRPGTFYMSATHQRAGMLPENSTTYYPSSADADHATPIAVAAGAQLQGLDIRPQSSALYTVRFALPEGLTPETFNAFLSNNSGSLQSNGATISANNKVVFSFVAPGSYEAVVFASMGDQNLYGIQRVDVTNGDVDGGTFALSPGVTFSGTVRVEGGKLADFTRLHINLDDQFRHPYVGNRSAEVNADGSFELKDAMPGMHELFVNRVPGVYLKFLRIGDKQLPDRHIDLSSKLEAVTIVLGADMGEVEGSVRNSAGDPVARARVNVIAYGDHADRNDFNRFGFSDDKGEFKIKDVPPGDYKVFAWEDVPVGAPQDPEFRKPFEKQAATLKMPPNGHEKAQVTVISADQVHHSSR